MPEFEHKPPEDWTKVTPEVAKIILAQGESFLKAQMQFALDADKRALALAAGCITFSTATFAASLVSLKSDVPIYLVYALIAVSLWALIAASLSFYAARPVVFGLPGSEPSKWWGVANGDVATLVGGETENYQRRIIINGNFLKSNSRYVKISMTMFAVSPLIFFITSVVVAGTSAELFQAIYSCTTQRITHPGS